MRPLNRKLLRDVWHLRGQVMAIALVVACGVASFVTMRSNYDSLKATQASYYTDYRFADVFANLKRAPDSLKNQISAIHGVATVETRIVRDVTVDVKDLEEPATARLVSVPEKRTSMLNDLYIKSGRYIEGGKRDEVLISEAFSTANHLQPNDEIAVVINGRWQKLRIVGVALSPEYVYEIRGGDIFPDNKRLGIFWMSREALGPAFNMEDAFNDVSLTLAPDANEKDVIEKLDVLLARYGGLGAYSREDQISNHFVSNEIAELNVTGTFIPAVFLGVTAFLIHLVMTRLVGTQREQIAILKAFGYSNTSIGWHYLKLALVAVSGGIILGLAVGSYYGEKLTAVYAEFFRFPVLRYDLNPQLIGAAVLITFGAATIGAFNAVRRAIKLPPAEAMRPEPPARFQAGFFERLGFHRLLTPSGRIIFRNLVRHPLKAFFSTLGISLSVTLLVVGFYLYFDAISRIIDVQFNTVQREDVTVIFNEARPIEARYDLANLRGVLRVEPFRAVAVRLRFQHRTRRTAIMGLTQNAELRRLVDKNFRPFELPQEGLVLATKLADIMGVKQGDLITIEMLEGKRNVRQVPVTALVDELIGLSAYMDIRALNRLMGESETISGAHLLIDSREAEKLYAQLKTTPSVSGVMIPEATLANFYETIAKTVYISTGVLIVFACIIAFGMVYNGARIALSERGRELSSLRVLGFNQREIGMMLLGEQAVLTFLAIPLGWLIGYLLCALITKVIDTELMRLPLEVSNKTYAYAFVIIAVAAFVSGLLVRWRLRHLDLIAVLKVRE